MRKIALFDLDGTLADYDGALRRDLRSMLPPDCVIPDDLDPRHMPPWLDVLVHTIRAVPGWWRRLPRQPLGWQIYGLAKQIGFDSHILTKGPASNPAAWGEKVQWVQDEFAFGPEPIITITQDKSAVYGRVLVDDYIPYVVPWLKARPRGLVVMPAHPWNDPLRNPLARDAMETFGHRIMRYDGSTQAYATANRLLREAFDRETEDR